MAKKDDLPSTEIVSNVVDGGWVERDGKGRLFTRRDSERKYTEHKGMAPALADLVGHKKPKR
jgi:hypothetical protein